MQTDPTTFPLTIFPERMIRKSDVQNEILRINTFIAKNASLLISTPKYHIYAKYSMGHLTILVLNFEQVHFSICDVSKKTAGLVANSVDPVPHSMASDLSLHCLLRPVCLNILGLSSRKHAYIIVTPLNPTFI